MCWPASSLQPGTELKGRIEAVRIKMVPSGAKVCVLLGHRGVKGLAPEILARWIALLRLHARGSQQAHI